MQVHTKSIGNNEYLQLSSFEDGAIELRWVFNPSDFIYEEEILCNIYVLSDGTCEYDTHISEDAVEFLYEIYGEATYF